MGEPVGLAATQLRALDRLTAIGAARDFYLAGGSAIAVHLGHRVSRDLDLFSRLPDGDLEAVSRALIAAHTAVEVVAVAPLRVLPLRRASLRRHPRQEPWRQQC